LARDRESVPACAKNQQLIGKNPQLMSFAGVSAARVLSLVWLKLSSPRSSARRMPVALASRAGVSSWWARSRVGVTIVATDVPDLSFVRQVYSARRATRPPNKGMKQTKPAQAMELRSLSPVLGGPSGTAEGVRSVAAVRPFSKRSDLERVGSNWHKTLRIFARGEYSLAILRAATTLELALTLVIRRELQLERSLPQRFVDGLLKWANGIDGKLKRLYLPILEGSTNYSRVCALVKGIQRVNAQRNDIVHRGEFRKKEAAVDIVSLVGKLVLELIEPYEPGFTLESFIPSRTDTMEFLIPGGGMISMPRRPKDDQD